MLTVILAELGAQAVLMCVEETENTHLAHLRHQALLNAKVAGVELTRRGLEARPHPAKAHRIETPGRVELGGVGHNEEKVNIEGVGTRIK